MESIGQNDVARLQVQMEQLIKSVELAAEESRSSRRITYEQLESIRLQASHTERTVSELHSWRPSVDAKLKEIDRWKERGIGAWIVVSASAAVIGGAAVFFWEMIKIKFGITTE